MRKAGMMREKEEEEDSISIVSTRRVMMPTWNVIVGSSILPIYVVFEEQPARFVVMVVCDTYAVHAESVYTYRSNAAAPLLKLIIFITLPDGAGMHVPSLYAVKVVGVDLQLWPRKLGGPRANVR